MLAWNIEERLKCNECGTRREEWDNDHNAYHVSTERCIGCEKVEWEQESWREDRASAHGLKFRLVRPNEIAPVRLPPNAPN